MSPHDEADDAPAASREGAEEGPGSDAAGSASSAASEEPDAELGAPPAPARIVRGDRELVAGRLPVGRWSPVHPDHRRLLQWTGFLRATVLTMILAGVLLVSWIAGELEGLRAYGLVAGGGILVVVLFLHAWLWPERIWDALRFRVDASGIDIREGVVWQSAIVVACSRIQHTEVVRGPLQRSRGLATLLIHTAGNANETIDLPGLQDELAYDLRDWLIAESARARRE